MPLSNGISWMDSCSTPTNRKPFASVCHLSYALLQIQSSWWFYFTGQYGDTLNRCDHRPAFDVRKPHIGSRQILQNTIYGHSSIFVICCHSPLLRRWLVILYCHDWITVMPCSTVRLFSSCHESTTACTDLRGACRDSHTGTRHYSRCYGRYTGCQFSSGLSTKQLLSHTKL